MGNSVQSFSISVHHIKGFFCMKPWCLYALQQYTPPYVWNFSGWWTHTYTHKPTHTHTHTYTHTQLHETPPLFPTLPFPPSSFFLLLLLLRSLAQCLLGPLSAARMMDSRLMSRENHSSPQTSYNSHFALQNQNIQPNQRIQGNVKSTVSKNSAEIPLIL